MAATATSLGGAAILMIGWGVEGWLKGPWRRAERRYIRLAFANQLFGFLPFWYVWVTADHSRFTTLCIEAMGVGAAGLLYALLREGAQVARDWHAEQHERD